jgi:hypothetical protein
VAGIGPATGFWSYAHFDNSANDGHVLRLAEQVSRAYQFLSGEPIKIFVDRSDLKWGEEWLAKINATILGTTFFIPVISPSYLKSKNCRNEFIDFWRKADTSNLRELLLPILYADVDLSEDTTDEICQIVRRIQFVDWRETQLEDETSSPHRKLVRKMAQRLVEVAQAVSDVDESESISDRGLSPADESTPDEGGDGDEGGGVGRHDSDSTPPPPDSGGLLDASARVEELLALYITARDAAQVALVRLLEILNVPGPTAGATAAQQLIWVNAISDKLQEPADAFLVSAQRLEDITRELTTEIITFVDIMSDPLLAEEPSDVDWAALKQMPDQFAEQFGNYHLARKLLNRIGRTSRGMKKPIAIIERGFDSLDAVREMLTSWVAAFGKLASLADQPAASQDAD